MVQDKAEIGVFVFGFVCGIAITFALTILVGWIINSGFPSSSWLNKGFYGYLLGCRAVI